jgi:hypothetical protein
MEPVSLLDPSDLRVFNDRRVKYYVSEVLFIYAVVYGHESRAIDQYLCERERSLLSNFEATITILARITCSWHQLASYYLQT